MAKAYKEMNLLKRKQRNEEMWVNGMYQLSALNVALSNAFSKHKIKYIEEPLNLFPKSKIEKEEEKRNEKKKLIEWLNKLTIKPKEEKTGS